MNDGACTILEVLFFWQCIIDVYFHVTILPGRVGGDNVCSLHTSAVKRMYYNHRVSS